LILFNSWSYILFLLIVFSLYWILGKRLQNLLLLMASYIFYASWDYRFLSLIIFSTLLDFFTGKKIHSSKRISQRRLYLMLSICGNLSVLGFFKYYNFFIANIDTFLRGFGLSAEALHLSIILPIGISFYTFQTLSYTIDIYRKQLKPTKDILSFAVFVAFFPQLVAGPIERAKNLLPQLLNTRKFDKNQFISGIDLIIWGLLKKIVIADNVGFYVNTIFNLESPSTLLIIVGVIGFGVQILADFSAYTDIARGSALLFGITLMKNFDKPYLARNPAEFWKRWHISLSTWVRDYIYIPLGGSRCTKHRYLINIFITWFLMGLWHGAAWHFIIWGLIHGAMVAMYRLLFKNIKFSRFLSIPLTFIMVHIGWLIFRAESMTDIWSYFSSSALRASISDIHVSYAVFAIIILYCIPWFVAGFFKNAKINIWRVPYYTAALMTIMIFAGANPNEFIYFQF